MNAVMTDNERHQAPEALAGLMSAKPGVAALVSAMLAESAKLRGLLAECAANPKQAKAIASRAADIPAVADPRAVMEERHAAATKVHLDMAARLAADRAKAEKAERVAAARRELARLEAERKREEDLRALVTEADTRAGL